MDTLTLKDLVLKDKRVLMRVDFNVPLSKDGKISDDSRIIAALPSIEFILSKGAALVLMSHLGRPQAKPESQFSLKPVAERLSQLLHKSVPLAPDCVGPEVKAMVSKMKSGDVLLLENVRFHPGEEEPEQDPSFTRCLAELGEIYVNDAFGSAHRAHASTSLIAKYFPGKAAAGFLMEKEIAFLSPLLQNPKRPFYAIIGGAKVSTKAGVINNLLKRVDALFLGGGMTFTFLKAEGIAIGDSLLEVSELKRAKDILSSAKSLYLPRDLVIADRFADDASCKIISTNEGIQEGWRGMDIGPATIREWSSLLQKPATVFWNGPLGVFEMPRFAEGTRAIALALARSTAEAIIGGGDSIAAIQQMGLGEAFAHLSTGGGASLEFLEFGHLPGIDALSPARKV